MCPAGGDKLQHKQAHTHTSSQTVLVLHKRTKWLLQAHDVQQRRRQQAHECCGIQVSTTHGAVISARFVKVIWVIYAANFAHGVVHILVTCRLQLAFATGHKDLKCTTPWACPGSCSISQTHTLSLTQSWWFCSCDAVEYLKTQELHGMGDLDPVNWFSSWKWRCMIVGTCLNLAN